MFTEIFWVLRVFRELRHNNFGTRFLHGAEVKISIELGAEFNIWCRSPQLGPEVT